MEIMDIVFCFDENMVNAACVAIASLLDSKRKEEHFNIYCICSADDVCNDVGNLPVSLYCAI